MANRRPLFAFSLLSFLLFVTVVCLSVSYFLVSRENADLNKLVTELKNELGHIEVKDAKKAYVRLVGPMEELVWRFRVYLPEGKPFKIRIATRNGGTTSQSSVTLGKQFSLVIKLTREKKPFADWKASIGLDRIATTTYFKAPELTKIIDQGIPIFGSQDKSIRELDPANPIELLMIGDKKNPFVAFYVELAAPLPVPKKKMGKVAPVKIQ